MKKRFSRDVPSREQQDISRVSDCAARLKEWLGTSDWMVFDSNREGVLLLQPIGSADFSVEAAVLEEPPADAQTAAACWFEVQGRTFGLPSQTESLLTFLDELKQ